MIPSSTLGTRAAEGNPRSSRQRLTRTGNTSSTDGNRSRTSPGGLFLPSGRPAPTTHLSPARDDASMDGQPGDAPGIPRWVKAVGIVALLLVAAFVVMHFLGLSPG